MFELDIWSQDINTNFILKNCLFGFVKLAKNTDLGKRSYNLLPDNTTRKNVIIFGADVNSSVHIDNKGKDIIILGDRPTQELHNTTLTAEAIYFINFAQSNQKFCLSLHYNGSNSFLFANATKIYQFKAKDSK